MKIGTYNIFTFFWFVLMLTGSGTLTYFSFSKNFYSSDAIFIVKVVIALISIIFICVFLYLLYKFKILIIHKSYFILIQPFLIKFNKIDISKSKSVNWKNFTAFRGTIYRKVIINQNKSTIEFSDLEFENFESLVKNINVQLEKKEKIAIEQALSNNSMMIINVIILSAFLIFLLISTTWKDIDIAEIIFLSINFILLFASIKRVLNYRKLIKTTHNIG